MNNQIPKTITNVEELPDSLDATKIYVVGESSHQWFVAMLCPCGCGETLHMSLMEGSPRWTLTEQSDRTATLNPSVARIKGCHSHFFLKRGLIEWCGQPG